MPVETISYCDWGSSNPVSSIIQDVPVHFAFQQATSNTEIYCITEILRSAEPSCQTSAKHETYIRTPYDPHVFIAAGYITIIGSFLISLIDNGVYRLKIAVKTTMVINCHL
jgi:hypothetical protein